MGEDSTRDGPPLAATATAIPDDQTVDAPPPSRAPGTLGPGDRIGDFELQRVLGKGAFAQVYLANQLSLDRLVAVKVSRNIGSEARTMASLEHDHIVHVFLETIVAERDLRLLCMQYVAGCTLNEIVEVLRKSEAGWDGHTILEIIDQRTLHPPAMDPAALRDRDFLDDCDAVEAVCWMGARLAEALAYAHSAGVLHRDVKPANIIVNPYGRPMLADFNIATDPRMQDDVGVGGTPMDMAPEHLEALLTHAGAAAVDRRADVYGLGVVLFELLTGRLPFERIKPRGGELQAYIAELATQRRAPPPSVRTFYPGAPPALDLTLRRCLEPDPGRRFQQASEVAQALVSCRELRTIERELPPPWPFPRASLRYPFAFLAVVLVAPQAVSSLVNIAYNTTQIVVELSPSQGAAFAQLVVGYNLVVYPVCLALVWRAIAPVYRIWSALEDRRPLLTQEVDEARAKVLTWTTWVTAVSCLGWFPGAVVFPLGISLMSERVSLHIFSHFLLSVAISGMIGITYSFFGVQYISQRVLYPRLWADTPQVRRRMAAELGQRKFAPRAAKLLAGTIPLVGAIMMVFGGPELVGQAYRLLVTALIMLGMLGFLAAIFAGDLLARTQTALLGTPERARTT